MWLLIPRVPSLHINLSGPDHSSYALQIISLDVELALWLPLLWFYNYSVLLDCHSLLICLSHLVLELGGGGLLLRGREINVKGTLLW